MRSQGGETKDFTITIGLYQGSTLSPYFFTLNLDVPELIQDLSPRCMFLESDIVLLGKSNEDLNEMLET